MAHFALLWKARTVEQYRLEYEREKIKSLIIANAKTPKKSLFQRISSCRYDVQKRISKTFSRWCPEGSAVSNFLVNLKTDQTFPNFVIKSVIGFVGGIVMTYLCFMFFVFQLAISLMHATIMSSIIGVLLTLGLAFSYRVRCLVFLLIPQFFSHVGRYTLTCYALVLILTGPATNTLKNSEVLSESMACSQEQLKHSLRQINEYSEKPYSSLKDTIKIMIDRLRSVAESLTRTLLKINRMALTIVSVMQSSFDWLNSVVATCNRKLGTPYERCIQAVDKGVEDCQTKLGYFHRFCNQERFEQLTCSTVESLRGMCPLVEGRPTLKATVKKRVHTFSERVKSMLSVSVQVHHSFLYSSNASRSASQIAAGIVTEIRSRADPLLTWLSWSSCVTSLSLLLIIFRAKYYQNMFETRSRFDNRYITKELRELDLKRMREGKETVLPLNRRERAKYVTTTSFRLVEPEQLCLSRSVVFMTITTFKLLIHIVADYSLFWVLTTIRYHGRFQSSIPPGPANAGLQVVGNSTLAGVIRSIVDALGAFLVMPIPAPVSCLPDPYPPDFQRYAQIGVLILILWFFSLFEPYGLRLRHVIMGLYRSERSKARAVWLYNHIIRTRSGFLKFARRKLHKDYKYFSEGKLTLRHWAATHAPFSWFPWLFRRKRECLLCSSNEIDDPDTHFIRCKSPDCPGIYCECCFKDIGQLCTICLSPADYGDLSDVSLEKGSSDESSSSDHDSDDDAASQHHRFGNEPRDYSPENHHSSLNSSKTSKYFLKKQKDQSGEELPLLQKNNKTSRYGKQQSYECLANKKSTNSASMNVSAKQSNSKQKSNNPHSNCSSEPACSDIYNKQGCKAETKGTKALAHDSKEGYRKGEKDTQRNKSIVMLLQRSSANMLSIFYKKRRCRLLVPKTNRSVYIMRKIHNRLEKVISANYMQRKYKRTRSYKTLKRFAQSSKNREMTMSFDKKIYETRDETVTGQDIKTEEANIIKLEADSIATVNACSLDVLKHKTKRASSFTTMLNLFHNKQADELDTTTNQKCRKKGDKETIQFHNKDKDMIVEGNKKEEEEEEKLQNANIVKSQVTGNISLTETFNNNLKDEASFQDLTCVNGATSGAAPSQTSVYSEISIKGEFGNDDNKDGQPREPRARTSNARTIFKKTCSSLFKKSSYICDSTTTTSRCTLELKQSGSCTCTNQNIIALRTLQRNFNKKCDIERQCNGVYDNGYDRNTEVRATRAEVSGILYNESNTSSVSEQCNTNGTTSTYYLNYNSVEFINERKAKDGHKKKEAYISDRATESTLGTLHDVSTRADDDWWSPMLDDRKHGCHQAISYNPIKLRFAAKRLVSFKSSPTIMDLQNPRRAALDHLWTSTPRTTNDKRWKQM